MKHRAKTLPPSGMRLIRPGTECEGWPLALALTAILILVVPLLVVGMEWTGRYVNPVLPALGVIAIAGVRFSYLIFTTIRSPYEVIFWIFTYLFLGVAPLVQTLQGIFPETTPRVDGQFVTPAWTVIYVGILGFIGGTTCAGRLDPPEIDRPLVGFPRQAAATAAVCISALAVIARLGPSSLFTDRYEFADRVSRIFSDPSRSALIMGFTSMGLLAITVMAIRKLRHQDRQPRDWALFAVSSITLLLMINPLTSPRFLVGIVALALLAAAGAFGSFWGYRLLFIGLLVGMVTLFPFLNLFRVSSGSAATGTGLASMTSGDFDAFAQIINTVDYVNSEGGTAGKQLLGSLLFFVPRSVWADKPTDTGILLADYQHYGFTNLSAPLWSEMYIDGGIQLVAMGFFLLGIGVRLLDGRVEGQIRGMGSPSIINCILPFYFLMVMRGSLLQAASQVVAIIACSLLATGLRLPTPEMQGQTAHSTDNL